MTEAVKLASCPYLLSICKCVDFSQLRRYETRFEKQFQLSSQHSNTEVGCRVSPRLRELSPRGQREPGCGYRAT